MDQRIAKIIKLLGAENVYLTGSRAICYPPPSTSDEDWVVFCPTEKQPEFQRMILDAGFTISGATDEKDYQENDRWIADGIDLIVCHTKEAFKRWQVATMVCRSLNLQKREDRCMVFHAIRHGNWVPPETFVRSFEL